MQGIRGALSPTITSPTSQAPLSPLNGGFNVPANGCSKPNSATTEYFPKLPTPISGGSRKDFPRMGVSNGTMSSSTTARPLNVRARLSSLSYSSRTRKMSAMSQSKQVLGSSVLTLQGPKRSREHIQRLSPTTSSRASPSGVSSNDASSEDENDKAEEEERRAEEQHALDLKLKNLQKMMTREALGFVASPSPISPSRSQIQGFSIKGKEVDRGRTRPLSASSASINLPPRLDMTRRQSTSQTPSHHSLSSASSPQGSIPSIPSPPPERRSQPQSPMARRLSEQFKSTSPPTVSTKSAWAQNTRHGTVSRTKIGGGRSERGSEMGSEASSFSDLSGKRAFRCFHGFLSAYRSFRRCKFVYFCARKCSDVEHERRLTTVSGVTQLRPLIDSDLSISSTIARSTLPGRRSSVR